jgi:UDP:flavonoid glycosyltransferase YjiC (YdhE family)
MHFDLPDARTPNARTGAPRPHFVVITSPVRGHFNPLLALATAIHERGGRVTFVHVADAGALIRNQPVEFRPVGGQHYPAGALDGYVQLLGKASGVIGTVRMVNATARMCAMLCRDAPQAIKDIAADVILADVAEPSGALIARHLNLPFISVISGLPLLADPVVPPPFLSWQPDTSRAGMARTRRAYWVTNAMMSPITRVLRRYARAWGLSGNPSDVLSPLLTVAQCPPGFDFERAVDSPPITWCGPFRADEDEGLDLPAGDGRPLIFCSLGTLQGGRLALFRAISGACADLRARAVIAHCGLLTEAQVKSLPGDPLVRDFWSQRAILGHVQAAIIHGGFNTVLDCLAAGVPMVVVPIAFEQPGTAARLHAAGAAVVIPRRRLTRQSLRAALTRVLHDGSFRCVTKTFANRVTSMDGAAYAADRILDACIHHRPWASD